MSVTMKPAIATIQQPVRLPEAARSVYFDDLLAFASVKKILDRHPQSPELLPVLILIAEANLEDKTSTSKLLAARTARPVTRTNLKLIDSKKELPEGSATEGTLEGIETTAHFAFGDVIVNVPTMEVCRNGRIVALKYKEFQLLVYLMKNPRRVISRDELLKDVWLYQSYPSTRTVDNHILRLRQKLESKPARPAHFITVHGAGYKFLP
jgi:DNA-binding response OmpR family regulator